MLKPLFFNAFLFIWSTGCLTPPEPSQPHPCEQADHCVYDRTAGESNCKEGYTWADPSDSTNYNCVALEGDACVPTTCTEQNANCGTLPDGCNGTLDCGECPVGQNCGAAGPNLCGEGECIPTTCAQVGAECGSISDGCGNILDCGGCPSGETCGAITANQCDVVCVPTTCDEQNAECGTISDGCSGTLDCGACPAGETCGADAPNQCGEGPCVPTTCAAQGAQCGSIPDGCSGTLDCGECGPGQVCGSVTANICSDIPCTPTTCAAQSATCGTIADGCGSTLNCGSCNGTDVCIQNACAGTDSDDDGVSIVGNGDILIERPLSPFAWKVNQAIVADLDGDGKTDILGGSGHGDAKLFWFKNYGDKQFGAALIAVETENNFGGYSSGGYGIERLSVGDIDKDGDLDIFTSGPYYSHWYQNMGNGAFLTHDITTSLTDTLQFEVADMDGDNINDLVAVEYQGKGLVWLKNDGQQSFTENVIVNSQTSGISRLWVEDLNQDQKVDIVVSGSSGVSVWKNNGNNNFEAVAIATTEATRAIVGIDLDNDGDTDLAYGADSGSLTWVKNDGNLVFSEGGSLGSVPYAESLGFFDVDTDGDLDLMIGGNDHFRMAKNTGTVAVPSFGAPELAYEDYRGGDAADFDGDGVIDFMIFGDDTWSNDAIHLELLYPNTSPSPNSSEPDYFRWPLIDREATDIAVADADNDGDLDIFGCIEYEQEINFLENLGDGHFAPRTLNGTWIHTPNGWEDKRKAIPIGISVNNWRGLQRPVGVAAGDIMDNGLTDVVMVLKYNHADRYAPDIVYMLNNGDGTYDTGHFDADPGYPMSDLLATNHIQILDFDQDGSMDIIVTSDQTGSNSLTPPNGHIVWVDLNNGQYTVRYVDTLENEEKLNHVAIGDIDGDGDNDVLWTGNDTTAPGSNEDDDYAHGVIAWSRNNGNGTFTRRTVATNVAMNSGWSTMKMALVDIDDDNDLDILVGIRPGSLSDSKVGHYYLNNGTGTFTAHEHPEDATKPFTYHDWLIADMNNDGRDDIVGTSSWYENNGDLTVTQHNFQYNSDHSPMAKEVIDLDGDGDLDLVTDEGWFENIGDNCPSVSNPDQADTDEDGIGDACE